MGRLSSKDKARLARLKLRGAARVFYATYDVTYEEFRTAFSNRFKDKHTDQYNYSRVQNASQEKIESPKVFLDRLRKLCQRTIRSSNNPVEQAVINQEADRRLLATFINGLIGTPGKQVRLQMPETIDKALNMAIIATNAEKEEKASVRKDRGTNARVFAVGGDRGSGQYRRYDKPRNRFQWSRDRGAWSQQEAGQIQPIRVDGTHLGRTDSRTPASSATIWTTGGCATSRPKSDDDRYAPGRPQGIQCYKCGLVGHTRSRCPRGQRINLNGIWRTKMTPPSNPK
jgi:hypothetical protein